MVMNIIGTSGVVAVLIALFIWLSKTLIKTWLTEDIKHEYARDLEELSANNARELAKVKAKSEAEYGDIKASLVRSADRQFELYTELWSSLCDLDTCVSDLWKSASNANLRKLAEQMRDSRLKVKKGGLSIEERHYKELHFVLDRFEDFRFGKKQLIDLEQAVQSGDLKDEEIQAVIDKNGEIKADLARILDEMRVRFKSQIMKTEPAVS